MSSLDARVRYTRMIIEQSFLELLESKPVCKITVTELCEKAQINRATFYKHYMDIPHLLECMEEDLFAQIRSAFGTQDLDLEAFLLKMLRHTYCEKLRFMSLGGESGDPNLMTKTFLVCYESAYPLLAKNLQELEDSERKMVYHFISHGSGGVLTWWIHDGMRISPEDVARMILNLSAITAESVQKKDWKERYRQ